MYAVKFYDVFQKMTFYLRKKKKKLKEALDEPIGSDFCDEYRILSSR